MKHEKSQIVLNLTVIVLLASLLVWLSNSTQENRKVPFASTGATPLTLRVNSQRDAYDIYKSMGLWGVKVVHLNQYLNMVEYYPTGETIPAPFPVRTHDIRSAYEQGLNSHNWLFIANRTGLVRSVLVILSDVIYQERLENFRTDNAFTFRDSVIRGHAQDMPILVTRLDKLGTSREPVIVNVDAGFFTPGVDPEATAKLLIEKCPEIRMMTLIESRDEDGVTDAMRKKLTSFETAFQGQFRSEASGRQK